MVQKAEAYSYILSAWRTQYPSSQSEDNMVGAGSACMLCHQTTSPANFNAYGWNIRAGMNGGLSAAAAILAAETADSDLDPTGSNNATEVNADTQPGYTAGPNNTWYFTNGSTSTNQNPPAGILGDLDPVDPWTDLGLGLAGTGGITPVLSGSGNLNPGSTAGLSLTNALPGSSAFLFIGLSRIDVPFRGGTLVPSNDLLLAGLPINGAGGLSFNFTWPSPPSGTHVYFQYWIVDAGGPRGASASNGLEAVTP